MAYASLRGNSFQTNGPANGESEDQGDHIVIAKPTELARSIAVSRDSRSKSDIQARRGSCYRIGVMVRRRFGQIAFGAVLAFAALGVPSCASPTLPLPPPALPTIELGATAGHYHLSSVKGAEPNAIIVIVNRNPNLVGSARVFGSEADADGTWEADITATSGDVVDITQEFGTTRSASTTVTIR